MGLCESVPQGLGLLAELLLEPGDLGGEGEDDGSVSLSWSGCGWGARWFWRRRPSMRSRKVACV